MKWMTLVTVALCLTGCSTPDTVVRFHNTRLTVPGYTVPPRSFDHLLEAEGQECPRNAGVTSGALWATVLHRGHTLHLRRDEDSSKGLYVLKDGEAIRFLPSGICHFGLTLWAEKRKVLPTTD
jgi:hypothetical protein